MSDPEPRDEQRDEGRRTPSPDRSTARDARTGRSAAAARMHHQSQWVDLQIREAMARGDFDDLPGYGKPLEGLGHDHHPDWWLKQLIEREQVSGVLPPALQLRKDDAALDDELDHLGSEPQVRHSVDDFNLRVREARRQLLGGPPVITRERDADAEVERWRARRAARTVQRQETVRKRETVRTRESHDTGKRRWRWRLGD